ncbi:hypothetical protein M427DRAFT_60804 [Gonapodya prolifera JEL478]|uniref:FHA domain-containing protein n=1 Tax=Gonapodya prolifera (strain JEL478) TaxID=1344416 RepID=A0A139A389_GONPJ|nr:hypothetical protein M427DRAFT_60804 [Gonapodya prolifera JEL478]|eukprot:KXS11230.1 hypothetical protein M427DRAFT_60804 [Gonapodya prolifera JEL478]
MKGASTPVFLILEPTNDTFSTKRIELRETPVKVGRKASPKVSPATDNAIFESKVLSRAHAEIWADGGHVYIKDVGSSNGTFVNGGRLSEEGATSTPRELRTGDSLDFGIDICHEDGTTIMYKKVSAKVRVESTVEQITMTGDVVQVMALVEENISRALMTCEQLDKLNAALDAIQEFVEAAGPASIPPAVQRELDDAQLSLRAAQDRADRADRDRAEDSRQLERVRLMLEKERAEAKIREDRWESERRDLENRVVNAPGILTPPRTGDKSRRGIADLLADSDVTGPGDSTSKLEEESGGGALQTAGNLPQTKAPSPWPALVQLGVGMAIALVLTQSWQIIGGGSSGKS